MERVDVVDERSQLATSPLKEDARTNMERVDVVFERSHFDTSLLKEVARLNMERVAASIGCSCPALGLGSRSRRVEVAVAVAEFAEFADVGAQSAEVDVSP